MVGRVTAAWCGARWARARDLPSLAEALAPWDAESAREWKAAQGRRAEARRKQAVIDARFRMALEEDLAKAGEVLPPEGRGKGGG